MARSKKTSSEGNKRQGIIDRYLLKKDWEKMTKSKLIDQDLIDYYIYNDLPLDDLLDGKTKKDGDKDL